MELTVPTFVFFGIGGSPEYHTSNYDGTFTLLQSCPVPSSFKPRSVDAADFDGDGKDDLVIGTDRVNYVMFSSSNQFCDFIPLDLGSDAFLDRYDEVEAADMDNDGNIDIMVVGSFGTKKFLKNGESGGAQDTLISVPPPSSGSLNPSAICLYDFDGDGFLDAVESYKNSEGPVALHLNDKKGVLKFEKFIHGTVGQYLNCEIADLDGDGDMDVVVGKLFGNVAILRNEGNLNFTPIELNGSEGYVGIGDFNNDGNIDIVTQESYGQSEKGATYIWKNNGSGEFVRDEELFSTETASTQFVIFDLDEDGRLDIILATFEDGAFVFMNNGYGSLTPPSFTEIGTSTGIPNIFGMALMDPITNSMSPSLTPSVSTSPSVSPVQLPSAAPSLQPSSSPAQAKSGKKRKKRRGKGSKKSSKSGKS